MRMRTARVPCSPPRRSRRLRRPAVDARPAEPRLRTTSRRSGGGCSSIACVVFAARSGCSASPGCGAAARACRCVGGSARARTWGSCVRLRHRHPDHRQRRAVHRRELRRDATGHRSARGATTRDDDPGHRPPVVLGGALPGHGGGHRERDPHPRAHARERGGDDRRRDPLLLGPAAEPQDRHDPRPPQPRAALRRQARPLPRAVRGVLRRPARPHGDVRLRRRARRLQRAGCAPRPRPRQPHAGARGRASARSSRRPVRELPHDPRHRAPSGEVGPDLTHVGSRATLAGADAAQRRGGAADWLRDPQHVKPGNHMPDLDLSDARRSATSSPTWRA